MEIPVELLGSRIINISVSDDIIVFTVEKDNEKYDIVIEYNNEHEYDETAKPLIIYYLRR